MQLPEWSFYTSKFNNATLQNLVRRQLAQKQVYNHPIPSSLLRRTNERWWINSSWCFKNWSSCRSHHTSDQSSILLKLTWQYSSHDYKDKVKIFATTTWNFEFVGCCYSTRLSRTQKLLMRKISIMSQMVDNCDVLENSYLEHFSNSLYK